MLGRFRIKRKLGVSATGTVFRAEDTLLEVPIGLKIFSPALAADAMYKAISREILLTRRLNHPSICRIHDLHEEQDHRFLTMDWVEGVPLDKMLARRRQRLAIGDALRIVGAAGEAVAAAHEAGIVHRGLKPANLMVADDGTVTVMDFGHARSLDMGGQTVANVRQEDMAYTAQEVLFGRPADQAADVYSLGAILYRCITGRTPLEAGGPVHQDSGFRGLKPPKPSKLNRQVPAELEQVMLTAIAANPEARYRNAGEFTAELLDTVEDVSVRARRPRRAAADLEPAAADADDRAVGPVATQAMERATLLFSDIVGITSFFEQHGDVAGRQRIDRHNQVLFPIIRKHGGSVLKTIGDAIMAAFDDEDDAVEAAIHMQQALEKRNQQNPAEVDRIYIRIGINSGETIQEYGDAYGDAVNVAARVCAKADGEQILVSEETQRELTRNRDIVNPHSRVSLKGKRDKFQLFQVDWLLADEEVEEPPFEQLPPDLSASADEDGPEPTGDATAVVPADAPDGGVLDRTVDALAALAGRSRQRRDGPPGMLDRLFDFFGLEPTRKNAIALAIIAGLLLLIVIGLFFALCSGGAVEVTGDQAGRPPAPGDPFGPAGGA